MNLRERMSPASVSSSLRTASASPAAANQQRQSTVASPQSSASGGRKSGQAAAVDAPTPTTSQGGWQQRAAQPLPLQGPRGAAAAARICSPEWGDGEKRRRSGEGGGGGGGELEKKILHKKASQESSGKMKKSVFICLFFYYTSTRTRRKSKPSAFPHSFPIPTRFCHGHNFRTVKSSIDLFFYLHMYIVFPELNTLCFLKSWFHKVLKVEILKLFLLN